MFSYLYEWIMKLSFYMVMVTMVLHVVPNSDYKRYIRFFTGLVLTVMLTDPFFRLLGMGQLWQNLYESPVYREQVEKMEEEEDAEEEEEEKWSRSTWPGETASSKGSHRCGRW